MFTLQEAQEAIKNKPEFRCNEREFGFVIDYNVAFVDTFKGATERETLILQNLRGTCFNDDGKIIRLAYHKFHNLNENEEYHERNFDFKSPHVIQEKLDGSMVTPIPNFGRLNTGYEFATRAGVTDVADKAMRLLQSWKGMATSKYVAYNEFIEAMVACHHTPIFEFCSREQRIVIDYPEPKLVLTAVRSNVTGEYLKFSELRTSLFNREIDLVKNVYTSDDSIGEFANVIKDLQGEEGVVIKFDDGRFVKIKAADYVLKHRALDGLRFEKDVLKLVLLNEVDDVLPLVTPEVRVRLELYRESVWNRINMAQNELLGSFERLSHLKEKKDFAALVKDSPYKNGLFKLYDGKEYHIKDYVLSKCGSITDVESVRWLIGKSYLEF